jgi:ABC-2 type transport system ATP-binding protein
LIEEPAFWPFLSGRRNLQYLARSAGPRQERDFRLARVDEVLNLVDLQAGASKKVKAYSQGMRQRLAIASALLGEPKLLVLDEPTNGLDPGGMREIRALLRRLTSTGTTVFVSSHLLFEVEAMCDRVAVLAHGKLLAEGSPSELRRASNRLSIDVDDRTLAARVLSSIDGVSIETEAAGPIRVRLSGAATAASVNAALVGAGVAVHALQPEQDSLEEAFVHLVEGEEAPR